MKKTGLFKKIVCAVLAAIMCMPSAGFIAYALETWADDCYVVADGACLMDADTGTVLFGQNADTAYYPASITKVLTALLVLENCESLSEQVTFSYDAVHLEEDNATIIGASEGDRLSVLDCLYCLLFQSANEVANALAEHVGAKFPELKETGMSDRDVFVRMMNDKAGELGCKGSHFNNPSGLTDDDHYTTAYDMCLIMAAAIRNEQFLDIESHTYWTHAPIARYPDADDPWNTVYPKHSMMKKNNSLYYQGTIAGKTGYTLSAGNTLVTAVKRDGMTLVCCILNGHSTHYSDTIRLMNFGFDNFISLKISDYDDINSVIVGDFSLDQVTLIDGYVMGADADARVTIPAAGSFIELKKEFVAGDGSGASASGGKVTYYYGDRAVGSSDIRLMRIGDASQLSVEAESDPILRAIFTDEEDDADLISENDAQPEGEESEVTGNASGSGLVAESAAASAESTEDEAYSAQSLPQEISGSGKEGKGGIFKIAAAVGGIIVIILAALTLRVRRERKKIKERARKRAIARRLGRD